MCREESLWEYESDTYVTIQILLNAEYTDTFLAELI